MGGQVFTSGPDPLYTPRMPPGVYQHVKATCHEKLKQIFEQVATPIEGPGKPDVGDIDFLVHGSITDLQSTQWRDAVSAVLGAERCFLSAGTCGFIRDPLAPSPETFRWSVFKQDHGDLWNLLGSTIRPYGLTIDHEALYVRIAEIEKFDKKKAKIHLTSDPEIVLQFLGLDLQQWKQPFASMEDSYKYAATSRFFWVKPESDDKSDGSDEERIEGEFTRKNLNLFPKCREQHRFTDRQTDREATLEEVFERFGVRETYDARVLEFRQKRQAETIWKDVIKATVPSEGIEPMFRGCAANGLKRIIMQGDESYGVVPSEPLKDETGLFDEDAVRRFSEAHWKKVGDIGLQRNHEKTLVHKAKLAKETEQAHKNQTPVS
ncbi:hypothetical protein PG994_005517 [Apiospora phragmitis]|uniref:Uncharacterized protein n=1 Tax=Apiospora phragmitis TaxID=2905665 RepID=A0ABR1VF06_9PEZI